MNVKGSLAMGKQKPWARLEDNDEAGARKPKPAPFTDREEANPVFEVTEINMLDLGRHTFQNFAFDVDNQQPIVAVLPMQNVPGWHAILDGVPIPVFSTGPDMVGVDLPGGAHRLVFEWRMPLSETISLYISLAALLTMFITWFRVGKRGFHHQRS